MEAHVKRANNWAATSCDDTDLDEATGIARSTTHTREPADHRGRPALGFG
jgi:hypothetical protein